MTSNKVATNYLYSVAKPDGLTIIGSILPGVYMDQLVGRPEVKVYWAKFVWIGSPVKSESQMTMRADAPHKSIDDIRNSKEPAKCGSTGTSGSDYMLSRLLEEILPQALLANQIHFIFSVGPQMPAVWEGNDIMLLAQQVGRPTFSLVVTPDIQKIADLKGKKIGVTFGGSTAAGTKALLELNKMNPDKDVEYIGLPGNEPKIAALKQGIISAALLAPPADFLAMKSGMKRLVSLAEVFKDTAFTGLAATSRTIKENPQMVKRMVRAIVRSVIYTRDTPEDALQVMIKRLGLNREAAQDAYQMIREALVPVPTEKGVELMAQWQAIALNTKPKITACAIRGNRSSLPGVRKPAEYMDLRFVNEVMAELGQK